MWPSNVSMSDREVLELHGLHDRWVALDPRGGDGLAVLPTGAVVVDYDEELDELCRRITASQQTSLQIVYCGPPPRG